MRALVIGGTGKSGSAAIAELRAAGAEGVPAARTPPPSGVALDVRDAQAVEAAARGFDAAFLITPITEDEADVGVAAVEALRRAGVGKIVYLAIHNLESMRAIPHFETKIPIKAAVLEAGGVVLQPNFFMQNDYMFQGAILHGGVVPMPIGTVGVHSIDARDIGRAAARALTLPDWDGQAVPLCGPDRMTGPGMAETYTRVLGRPVRYAGDDTRPFIGALKANMPGFGAWEEHDFRTMMEVTQAVGCLATDDDLAATRAILGRPPRAYIDHARELTGVAA